MILEPYKFVEAGNHSSRKRNEIDGVIFHYTAGGSGRKTAQWAKKPIGRSWHFLNCRDGYVIQQVKLDRSAWHAGRSEWPRSDGETVSGANRCTVGIELANHGLLEKTKNGFFYEINGQMFRYRGLPPVEATLVFDNGVTVTGWWEPFPEGQLKGLDLLLERLEKAGVPMRFRGHESIAQPFAQRKIDPGPLFPWERYGGSEDQRTSSIIL